MLVVLSTLDEVNNNHEEHDRGGSGCRGGGGGGDGGKAQLDTFNDTFRVGTRATPQMSIILQPNET